MTAPKPPKEKLLTTRVSTYMDAELRRLRVNISKSVRNVLAWEITKKNYFLEMFDVKVEYSPVSPEDEYWQEEYVFTATVDGLGNTLLNGNLIFCVPEILRDEKEVIRIYSSYEYKEIFPGSRSKLNARLLGAKVENGKWVGHAVLTDVSYAGKTEYILGEAVARIEDTIRSAVLDALEIASKDINVSMDGQIIQGTFKRFPNCTISVSQPDNYQYGAWKVEIVLTDQAKEENEFLPYDYLIPKLENRLINMDSQYSRAAFNKESGEYEIMMRFVDGVAKAHVYTNGIHEDENSTSLDEVCNAISLSIKKAIGM